MLGQLCVTAEWPVSSACWECCCQSCPALGGCHGLHLLLQLVRHSFTGRKKFQPFNSQSQVNFLPHIEETGWIRKNVKPRQLTWTLERKKPHKVYYLNILVLHIKNQIKSKWLQPPLNSPSTSSFLISKHMSSSSAELLCGKGWKFCHTLTSSNTARLWCLCLKRASLFWGFKHQDLMCSSHNLMLYLPQLVCHHIGAEGEPAK